MLRSTVSAVSPLAINVSTRQEAAPRISLATLTLPPVVVTLLLWVVTGNELSLTEVGAGLLLLCIPWWSYHAWRRNPQFTLPVFASVAGAYWVAFGLPLFLGDRFSPSIWTAGRTIAEDTISQDLLLVLLGIVALWGGTRIGLANRFVLARSARRQDNIQIASGYLRLMLLLGIALSLWEGSSFAFGEGWRQLVVLLNSVVPTTACAILFRALLRAGLSNTDRLALFGFLIIEFTLGIASGWLGPPISLILICCLVYVSERTAIPWMIVLLFAAVFLFLQPGKAAVRAASWYGDAHLTPLERVGLWLESSSSAWQRALVTPGGINMTAGQTISRLNLLTSSAVVLELTPSLIPYQTWTPYSYLAITWIPRSVWADKPSFSDSNRLFQVVYGLTPADRLATVSIAVGALTEGYMAFGIAGTVMVMFLLGVGLDLIQQLFLHHHAGAVRNAVGIVLVLQLLNVESQMAQYVGGIVQEVVVVLVVLYPATRKRTHSVQSKALALRPLLRV